MGFVTQLVLGRRAQRPKGVDGATPEFAFPFQRSPTGPSVHAGNHIAIFALWSQRLNAPCIFPFFKACREPSQFCSKLYLHLSDRSCTALIKGNPIERGERVCLSPSSTLSGIRRLVFRVQSDIFKWNRIVVNVLLFAHP